MFIRYAALTLAFIPTLAVAADTTFSQNPFTDVPTKHVNYDAIEYLRKNNVLKGYADGSFKPEARINRAELVKLIANPFILDVDRINQCIPEHVKDNTHVFFNDVLKTDWFAPEVCMARVKSIVSGYPDGTFKPGSYTSFVEAAKILSGVFSLQVNEVPGDEQWYKPYVEKLASLKAIPLTIGGLSATVTRGEVAEMLYRLKADVATKSSKTASQLR